MDKSLTKQICGEIALAIRKLGGNPETINLRDAWRVNRVLEFLGADGYLLATICSWGDSLMTDAQVLDHLRGWNRCGSRALKPLSFIESQ
ncbi:MAG TPA: hypothetical protein VIB39_21135 [Candidatus Angelobacter sp.]|jgi:hypothetical protein